MRAEEAQALAQIRALYEEIVTYTGAGLSGETVGAIPSDTSAPSFQGPGATLRSLTFEIAYSSLPERPRKGNVIGGYAGNDWTVDDITERDDLGAWVLGVQL